MIPKILHQIWIGPNKIPKHIQEYCNINAKIFDDYEYKFWHNDNIPQMPDACYKQFKRYEKRQKYAFQADILRYFILNQYGGIYMDVDFICKVKFDHIVKKNFFCVSPNANVFHVCNGIFGCVANNPILTNIVDNLKNEPYHGPLFFTHHISKFLGVPYKTNIYKYLQENDHYYVQCESPTKFFLKTGYCFHDALKSWLPKK